MRSLFPSNNHTDTFCSLPWVFLEKHTFRVGDKDIMASLASYRVLGSSADLSEHDRCLERWGGLSQGLLKNSVIFCGCAFVCTQACVYFFPQVENVFRIYCYMGEVKAGIDYTFLELSYCFCLCSHPFEIASVVIIEAYLYIIHCEMIISSVGTTVLPVRGSLWYLFCLEH